jgi:hypothetical protein
MRGNNGSLRQNLIAEFRRGFRHELRKSLGNQHVWNRKPKKHQKPRQTSCQVSAGMPRRKKRKGRLTAGIEALRGHHTVYRASGSLELG